MFFGKNSRFCLAFAALLIICLPSASRADMTLNGSGTGFGFILTKAISGVYATVETPVTNAQGQLVIHRYFNDIVSVFSNKDNQTTSDALISKVTTPSNLASQLANGQAGPITAANVGGILYGSQWSIGGLFKMNDDGTVASVVIPSRGVSGGATSYSFNSNWKVNPSTGHILSSGYNGVYDVDPATGVVTQVAAPSYGYFDLAITMDGKTIYGTGTNAVEAFDPRDGRSIQVYPVPNAGSSPLALIGGSGPLAGDLVIEGTNGGLILLDPKTGVSTVISSTDSYGPTFGFDSTDGSLLVPRNDGNIYRLSCGAGCSFIHGGISTWPRNPTCP